LFPIITLSKTFIPNSSPVSFNFLFIFKSSGLGVGSPLGWLWTRIIFEEAFRMAGRKTSRGWMIEASRIPLEIRWFPMMLFWVLSIRM